jgi:tetratricopeptide (TPR) repeat protein
MAYGPQQIFPGNRVSNVWSLNMGMTSALFAKYPARWQVLFISLSLFLSLLLWYTSVSPFSAHIPKLTHVTEIPKAQHGEEGSARTPLAVNLPPSPSITAAVAFTQGVEALHAQRYEQAVSLFEDATRLDAQNAEYHLWLGRAYGYRARQVNESEQFFLARKVRKHLEKAVELNPDQVDARLDLLDYYLQAPSLLGGGVDKAKVQAEEIVKRDPQQGALARQRCQRAETQSPLFTTSALDW